MTKPHTHTQRCRWKRKEKFPCDNNTSCSQESEFINHLSCSRQQLWSFHLWPLRQTTSTKSCFCFYVLALYAIQCVLIWEGEGARGCLFLIPRSTLSHKDGVIYVSPVFFFFFMITHMFFIPEIPHSAQNTLLSSRGCGADLETFQQTLFICSCRLRNSLSLSMVQTATSRYLHWHAIK